MLNPILHEDPTGLGALNPLASQTYVQADVGLGQQISFNWEGMDDLVIVFDMPQSAGFTRRAVLDNMQLSIVPEPSSLALVLVVSGALLKIRRSRFEPSWGSRLIQTGWLCNPPVQGCKAAPSSNCQD